MTADKEPATDYTNEERELLVRKDRDYVWHQLTGYKEESPYEARIFTHGDGVRVFDIEGRGFIDGVSGLWCVNVGYGQKKLSDAAYAQLNRLPFYPMITGHIPAIELSEQIGRELGYPVRVQYSNSGSEANETALKIARQYQGQRPGGQFRYKFISRYRSYHGSTLGTLSATGTAGRKNRYEPLLAGFTHINPPYCYRCPYGQRYPDCKLNCAEELAGAINYEGEETVAGFIAEPIMAGGGVIVPPPEYWPRVAEICREKGVLLILDEVVTGFGRTGKMFGHRHWGVEPDIITFAKGLTSGYLPLSATAVKEHIFAGFYTDNDENNAFRHVNTFGGHAAACAVAVANLELIRELDLVEKARVQGDYLRGLLEELRELPLVGDIRGMGLYAGIEVVSGKKHKSPIEEKHLARLIKGVQERGVIIGKNTSTTPNYSNVLIIAPPLIIEKGDLDYLVSVVREQLAELGRELGRA